MSRITKESVRRVFHIVLLSLAGLAILGAMSFYLLIMSGLFPKIQSLWVCTAMTTLNHKYLATWFVPAARIEEIMAENYVDDSGYATDVDEIEIKKDAPEKEPEPDEKEPVDPYIEEGYELLEDGLYLKQVAGDNWKGYVMLTVDPSRVKLADTKNQFVCGQKVMTMIENEGAVAGINGGGFVDGVNYDSNGGTPAGLVIVDGKLISPTDGYAKQNNTYSMIGLNSDGVLVLRHCTAQWAMENDIVSAVSFNPFIIVNGEGVIKNGTGGWGIAPRTAIGQRKTGEILFLVIDGRQLGYSIGCDLLPLQETLLAEKCLNAAMMDGGSSTVMIHNKAFVNKPSLGFERYINNAWVVMPAEKKG
mgnify:FL=1